MTTKELRNRVGWQWSGYGKYVVSIIYRRKKYVCTSHNTLAADDYQSDSRAYYKTDKQCLKAFYDECKRANNLSI